MNADHAVTAAFSAVAQHTVIASVLPVGAGTIVLNPAGSTYNEGSTVSVAAVPAPGWAFASWQGDLSGTVTPATFVVSADRNIVAVFSQLPDRLLVTTVAGNGRVIRAPDVDYHPAGSRVALVAEPDPGFDFSGWSGDLAGSSSPDTIVMDTDKDGAGDIRRCTTGVRERRLQPLRARGSVDRCRSVRRRRRCACSAAATPGTPAWPSVFLVVSSTRSGTGSSARRTSCSRRRMPISRSRPGSTRTCPRTSASRASSSRRARAAGFARRSSATMPACCGSRSTADPIS